MTTGGGLGLVLEAGKSPFVEFGSSGFWRDAICLSHPRQALVTKPADLSFPTPVLLLLLTLSLFLILPAIDKAG